MKELKSIQKLAESFARLPGVGRKSAEKLAYAVLEMKDEDVASFREALLEVKNKIHHCKKCGTYVEDAELCEICSDEHRNNKKVIVVSYPKDVLSFEKLGTFDGTYHVLGGALSAINGIGISELRIKELFDRIEEDHVEEVILATNPTTEGETTALYIAKLLESSPVNVSRLAYGLPMGGHLEYADSLTLSKALEGRKTLK